MPGVNSIKLLTGNSHPELAQLVADRLGIPLTPCVCKKFADHPSMCVSAAPSEMKTSTSSKTGNSPYTDPNDSLMELLIILSACKTASARRITAVIPSFPYSSPRQEGQEPCAHHRQARRQHAHRRRCRPRQSRSTCTQVRSRASSIYPSTTSPASQVWPDGFVESS